MNHRARHCGRRRRRGGRSGGADDGRVWHHCIRCLPALLHDHRARRRGGGCDGGRSGGADGATTAARGFGTDARARIRGKLVRRPTLAAMPSELTWIRRHTYPPRAPHRASSRGRRCRAAGTASRHARGRNHRHVGRKTHPFAETPTPKDWLKTLAVHRSDSPPRCRAALGLPRACRRGRTRPDRGLCARLLRPVPTPFGK